MMPCASIVNDPVISANDLNHDLKVINQWDPNKQATELLFSCKKNTPNHPSFSSTVVPKVNEQKHLGLILDSKLSFERHINVCEVWFPLCFCYFVFLF